MNGGTFSSLLEDDTWAYGVRCVLDLDYKTFCELNSSYGALRCYKSIGCPGSAGNCYPNKVQSSMPSGDKYVDYELNSGSFGGPYNNQPTLARSVRCILDLDFNSNTDNCYPYFVWSDKAYSSTQHIAYLLNSGTFRRADQSSATSSTVATGVRCVLDLNPADTLRPVFRLRHLAVLQIKRLPGLCR